jgi:hypothetical protein
MNTPLEDEVHDALHRQVDPLQRAPFTITDVRTRARRIQRRRAMAAGAAVAAVIAVAVPFGLAAVGDPRSSEIPPATQTPTPTPTTAPTDTVRIDPRSAEVVDGTSVPLVDVDAPSVITPDGTTPLPGPFSTITPYLDGWVGVSTYEGVGTIEFLTADGEVQDGGSPSGGLVVSPDGQQIAWSEYTGTQWQVVVADPDGGVEWAYTKFPPGPQDARVVPMGFVAEGQVVVRLYDNVQPTRTYVAGGGESVELTGLLQADAVSQATGMVAGRTQYRPEGTCYGVLDGVARTGSLAWETCDHRLGPFSPDGSYVVGTDPNSDSEGSPTVAILDAATGESLVDFAVTGGKRQFVGIWSQMAWEDEEHLVVRVYIGEDYFMVRLGTDGSVQRIGIPATGASGLAVAETR